MIELIIGVAVVTWLIYRFWISPYSYWKNKGFPYLESKFPYGNSPGMILMDEFQGVSIQKLYNEMEDKPFAGIVLLRRPHLLLKDPDVIKAIMLKDFVHFTDRVQVDNIKEPLSHHLFNLGGDKWKALRVKMTPTFTSGKLKLMFPLFEACARSLEQLLEKPSSTNQEIDVKDVMGRFTTKILGTCAYGLDIDSLGDSKNPFVRIAQSIFPVGIPFKRWIIILLNLFFPGIEHIYRFRVLPKSMEVFLNDVVMETMSFRKGSELKRNDFIDLLMEIREQGAIKIDRIDRHNDGKDEKITLNITDDDLVAQVFVFLAAGFETSSSVTSYCLFELGENPDIQEKLRKEILAGQPLTYQSIQEMPYLDMVIHETMRKYPTLPLLTRKCTKQYRMPDGSILDKGVRVIIPVYALHHDPNYFPEPSKFDPERFLPENKNSRPQFAYLPFGEGPRICIGMRFGLLQTKMGITTLLSKYRVEKTPNTVSPLKLSPSTLITTVGHQIKLRLKPL